MKGELKMDVSEYLPLRDVVFNTLRLRQTIFSKLMPADGFSNIISLQFLNTDLPRL